MTPERVRKAGAVAIAAALLFAGVEVARAAERAVPVIEAVKNRDTAAVRALIQQRADVNAAEADGTTALHWAAHTDDMAAARLLVDAGARVAAANRYGVQPLTLACINGNTGMIELLLRAGADPNTRAPGGETALMTAARTGGVDAVRALVERGADVNALEAQRGQTALMWAAADGHAGVVRELMARGATLSTRSKAGFTALLFAVREGRSEAVEALLGAGAPIEDALPNEGVTAFLLAAGNAHYELAAALVAKGANPNAAPKGWTALHQLSWIRKAGIAGSNNPAPEGSGAMTSLEFARFLVAHGADPNARVTKRPTVGVTRLNMIGGTPFLLAARTADADLMRALVELGADPLLPNADGSTPLIVAAGLGTRSPGEDAGSESAVVEALQVALELGADIDAVDKNGETAMHGAAYKNVPAAVQFLADKGARIDVWNRENAFGWTPLAIAAGYRFGNFKPSPPTVAVFERLMKAAGVSTAIDPATKNKSVY
jgi:ankyrin repeat protein